MRFPKVQSTFGVTPYNPERDSDEKRRAIFEHYQSQMGAQPLPPETLPWNKPFPPGVEAQQAFDTMLQERVVDPLARAGYEGLGAGLAAIPSAAHEMIVPQTEFDIAGTIIPLPGVAKAMKQGKYRKIRAAMQAEDPPEKVGEIIAKQAGKTELPITQKANPAEVRSIDEKEMLRKADEAKAKENQILQKMYDDSIRDGIKEKYGIEGENWSVLEDNPDTQFGISDLSGKRGEVYEITDGYITIQVLSDEYLDIMGVSGGIPLSQTPFAQSMKKNKKALTPSDQTIERVIKTAEKDLPSKPGSADAPKPPKGDPQASLRGPFQSIRSQLDVAPARMDERGRSFENIGQSDFMPYERPQVGQFEDVQKRNYVERDLDPKEKMWNEIVASDPYLPDSPEYLKNLRNYFDNRWEQEQGTAEAKMIYLDMPMSERLKPHNELSVTSGYIDDLASKRIAEPYKKTIQAERLLAKKPGDKPVRAAIIDDKIQRYFRDEIKSPGRKLQDQMYPKKQIKPQLDTEVEDKDLFKKTKKAISKKAERDWVIVDADSGEDVTHLWQKDIKEGMTRQDAEEMFGNDSSYYVSDKYKKSDLKFIKKYGLEDIDNRTWSSVDPEADTEFGTCDLTGKKGPLVRMKALDKNGGEVEMEVLEDIAHKLHGLSGPY